MNKKLIMALIIFGIIIVSAPSIILPLFSEKVVIGEQLCVDGNNNINLAGIMCENTEFLIFGMSFKTILTIQLTSMFVGFLIFILSLFALGRQDALVSGVEE